MRAPFREKKIADYARRRDPRAGLGRGVRPSPISTATRSAAAGARSRLRPTTSLEPRSGYRTALQGRSNLHTFEADAPVACGMMPPVPALAIAFLLAVAAAIGAVIPPYLRFMRRELSRPDEVARGATRLGLAFSRFDPAYPGSTAFRHPFELFSRGIDQTCENFISGSVDGIPVVAFDFLYLDRVDHDGDPTNDMRSAPIRYSCAIATVAGHRPHVVIEPRDTAMSSRADGEPVRLEWGDFNARYRVISPERGFAAALLDLDLMAWLVDRAPRFPVTWEVQRGDILCRTQGLEPNRFPELVRALVQFARRIGPAAFG